MASVEEVYNQVEKICLELPIYSLIKNIKMDDGSTSLVNLLKYRSLQFDCHCIHCGKVTPFKTERRPDHYDELRRASANKILEYGIFTLHMHCQRNSNHVYSYIFEEVETNVSEIKKIGQLPSLEDIAGADLGRFRPVLERQYFSELHRAGGLISHGIGIGAFVYLRRIFERLIVRHHEDHGPIEGFDGMRMDEKIAALKAHLPAALIGNRVVYGILSKGIHELDEETCKRFYPVVRAVIVAILEEDLQALEKKRAADELAKSLAAIAGELSPPKQS